MVRQAVPSTRQFRGESTETARMRTASDDVICTQDGTPQIADAALQLKRLDVSDLVNRTG